MSSKGSDQKTQIVEKKEKTCVLCLYKQMSEHWDIPDERYICFKCRNQEGPNAGLTILKRRLFNQKTPEEKEAWYKQRDQNQGVKKEEKKDFEKKPREHKHHGDKKKDQ